MASDNGWIALVAASPEPESRERVNIGLLFGNGEPNRLEFIDGLPRLAGLVPPDELLVYESLLRAAAEQLTDGHELSVLQTVLAPQIRISEPRALYRPADDAVVALLRGRYLARRRPGPHKMPTADLQLQHATEVELDRIIGSIARLGVKVTRNPRIERLYPDALASEGFTVPRIARALRGDRRDLLVDSVQVIDGRIRAAIGDATARVGRAFWHYKTLRQAVEHTTGAAVPDGWYPLERTEGELP